MTATKPHILVIEDEPKISQLLVDYLERDNYQVSTLADGSNATEIIKSSSPSLVLLDLMLPGKDGLTICREVRQFSNVPIVMLTAKVDEIDRLIGLELGADDYICKPFSPREVVARVKTILRRAQLQPAKSDENSFTYRDVTVLPDKFECLANNQRIELTPVEFRMLQAMVARPGYVFSRDRLMNLAYTDERIVSDRTIDTHIKNIRRKLNDVIEGNEMLHSIYGVGYKLE